MPRVSKVQPSARVAARSHVLGITNAAHIPIAMLAPTTAIERRPVFADSRAAMTLASNPLGTEIAATMTNLTMGAENISPAAASGEERRRNDQPGSRLDPPLRFGCA